MTATLPAIPGVSDYDGPALHGGTVDDLAAQAWQDYIGVITRGMEAHPRSLQKMIGPSEIGDECNRALISKLAGIPEPPRAPAWKPAVGTAVHTQLEEWFEDEDIVMAPRGDRYLVEQTVVCGTINGVPLTGHTDLVDRWTGGIIDHKAVGKTRLVLYRRKGPGQAYRVQAHTYGAGWAARGIPVRFVMICFLPRDGELSEAFHWYEEFRPDVAAWALDRLEKLDSLWKTMGVEPALALFPFCDNEYCKFCAPQKMAAAMKNPFKTN